MPLAMLTRRQDFVAAKDGPDAAAHGARGFLLQGRLRPEASDISGPRYGITVSNYTIRRKLLEAETPNDRASNAAGGKKRPGAANKKRGPVSVSRNRMRRRLREALLLIAPRQARDDCDYVLIGRPAALTMPFDILLKDLEKGFQKVHRRIIPSVNTGKSGPRSPL